MKLACLFLNSLVHYHLTIVVSPSFSCKRPACHVCHPITMTQKHSSQLCIFWPKTETCSTGEGHTSHEGYLLSNAEFILPSLSHFSVPLALHDPPIQETTLSSPISYHLPCEIWMKHSLFYLIASREGNKWEWTPKSQPFHPTGKKTTESSIWSFTLPWDGKPGGE